MTTATEPPARPRQALLVVRRPWILPAVGLLLVAGAVVLQVTGIVQASTGNPERATLLAWLAIGSSVLALAIGLAAVIRRRAWRLGLVVLLAALLANPYLLTQLLNLFG